MRLHANARLSVKGRVLLNRAAAGGWSLTADAMAAGVSERTARQWRDRHRAQGADGDDAGAPAREKHAWVPRPANRCASRVRTPSSLACGRP
jgi:hypothetical protein